MSVQFFKRLTRNHVGKRLFFRLILIADAKQNQKPPIDRNIMLYSYMRIPKDHRLKTLLALGNLISTLHSFYCKILYFTSKVVVCGRSWISLDRRDRRRSLRRRYIATGDYPSNFLRRNFRVSELRSVSDFGSASRWTSFSSRSAYSA